MSSATRQVEGVPSRLGLRVGPLSRAESKTPTSCRVEILRQVTAYLVVPNVPFWLAGHLFVTVPRALINLDYLMVGLLGLFLPPGALILLFAVAVLLDVILGTISFFYFNQHDLFQIARYVVDIRWRCFSLAGLALLGTVAATIWLSYGTAGRVSAKNRWKVAVVFVGFLLVLTASRYRDSFEGVWLVSSPVHRMYVAASLAATSDPHILAPIHSATGALLKQANSPALSPRASQPRPNLVLVLVESYGLMRDVSGATRLTSPFHAPPVLDKYDVRSGTVEFDGPTVSGEFRELCGLKAEIGTTQSASEISGRCLPKLLEQEGYETTATHGFMGAMFDRKSWYRELGFENVQFLENLRSLPKMHLCNGLCPGICDADVAALIGRELLAKTRGKPQFRYWMTLSSHLPVPLSRENSALMSCESSNAANRDSGICNWMALIYKANAAIAELSLTPGLPATQFIIVGDHAPPFLSSKRRSQFSQTEVPFIQLVPKPPAGDAVASALKAHH